MVNELYGGRRGLFEHVRARTLYALGAYRRTHDIQWASVGRLVFVCKGNICRSPYACARAQSLGARAASFGIEASDGAPANQSAMRNAMMRGVDLSAHRSARMERGRLMDRDLLVVFEPRQITSVRSRMGNGTPVALLGIWARPARPYIHDPYGTHDSYFQHCFSVIDANIAALVEYMVRKGAPLVSGLPKEDVCESAANHNSCDRTPS